MLLEYYISKLYCCYVELELQPLLFFLFSLIGEFRGFLLVKTFLIVDIISSRGDKPHRASVVLVGFSNGYVYGYSMSGQTIFSKQIHEDSVTQLTFMSPSLSRRHESLVIFYYNYSPTLWYAPIS